MPKEHPEEEHMPLRQIWVVLFLLLGLHLTSSTQAHDIYAHLTNRAGKSCCDGTDCRPARYRTTSSGGIEMLVHDRWIWVPRGSVQHRVLEGDTGETNGGHWCGEHHEGGFITYCAFLPPEVAFYTVKQ